MLHLYSAYRERGNPLGPGWDFSIAFSMEDESEHCLKGSQLWRKLNMIISQQLVIQISADQDINGS
jgi:hypothetical protein